MKNTSLTNGDRIRQMSNEELAVYLSNICFKETKKTWLEWLNRKEK